MAKYRVYALIHGQVLPQTTIENTEIKKMPFEEQQVRGFAPIQAKFYESELTKQHKTYATSLAFTDPIRIRSEHVLICTVEESDTGAALGAAIRSMDKICRLLSFTKLEDSQKYHNRERLPFEPYLYQVNRVYLLEGANEVDPPELFNHGSVYLPDRPEHAEWLHSNSSQLFQDLLSMHDEPLERALKYLYRSAIGNFVHDSPEKIAVDHVKAIEILLKTFRKKGTFKQRLEIAKQKLDLTDEEVAAVEELWKVRSEYGDIAHPSAFDQAERYPNQFPLPSNAATHSLPSSAFAANICLKYFRYRQRLYAVDVETPTHSDLGLVPVNVHIETNHLIFYSQGNKRQLTENLKDAISSYLKISKTDIAEIVWAPGCKQAIILVKSAS